MAKTVQDYINEVKDTIKMKNDQEFILKLYEIAGMHASRELDWYYKRSKRNRFISTIIRFISIIFGGIAGLLPLLSTINFFKNYNLPNWGYILLAIAGLLLLIDKFLGVSSGWMRFKVAELKIRWYLEDFRQNFLFKCRKIDWEKPNPNDINAIYKLINTLTQNVIEINKEETNHWVSEFQDNMIALQKMVKKEIDQRKENLKIKTEDNNNTP